METAEPTLIRRSATLRVRCTPEEIKRLRREAYKAGVTVSQFVRKLIGLA